MNKVISRITHIQFTRFNIQKTDYKGGKLAFKPQRFYKIINLRNKVVKANAIFAVRPALEITTENCCNNRHNNGSRNSVSRSIAFYYYKPLVIKAFIVKIVARNAGFTFIIAKTFKLFVLVLCKSRLFPSSRPFRSKGQERHLNSLTVHYKRFFFCI